MNIYDQEITDALGHLASKVESNIMPTREDLIALAQVVDVRTNLLVHWRDQLISSEIATKNLISELESADLDMDDMDTFIGTLRQKLESV